MNMTSQEILREILTWIPNQNPHKMIQILLRIPIPNLNLHKKTRELMLKTKKLLKFPHET